jgi:sulfite reductase (ferredoxin)
MISFSGMARKINNRSVPFYRIHLGGKPDSENTILAQPVGRVPARAIPKLFTEFVTTLPSGDEESVYRYVTHQGKAVITRLIEKYSSVPAYEEDRSYYVDCGNTEDFSLTGFTKGECGSGAVDMVDSDLESAKNCLESARKKSYNLQEIKNGLLYSSRALLVIKGVDPKEEGKTIRAFKESFISPGLCDPQFEKIESVYQNISTNTIEKKEAYEYTTQFYEEVKRIYSLMDSSFNFPVRFPKHTIREETGSSRAKKNNDSY